MPKTVFRVKLRLVRPGTHIPFYGSMPGIENAKVEWKLTNKILCNNIEISKDGLTRSVQIDFIDEATRNEFRQMNVVDEGMRGLYMYNSLNNIVTYVDEALVSTSDYD